MSNVVSNQDIKFIIYYFSITLLIFNTYFIYVINIILVIRIVLIINLFMLMKT